MKFKSELELDSYIGQLEAMRDMIAHIRGLPEESNGEPDFYREARMFLDRKLFILNVTFKNLLKLGNLKIDDRGAVVEKTEEEKRRDESVQDGN